MTTGEEHLARTLIDILGEDEVVNIVGPNKMAEILGNKQAAQAFGVKRLIEMLHILEPSLTAEEFTKLLNEAKKQNSSD